MRKAIVAGMIAAALGGCASPMWNEQPECLPAQGASAQPLPAAYANPIFLPIADPQCAWETIVDVVDDYFRIDREEPVRLVGNMLTEGSIITVPEVSPTVFEPWRNDTVDYDQRVENTLQSMRRRAVIRVIPAQGGYQVDVAVFKDLEDLIRPEQATAGAATFRYDSTLTGIVNPVGGEPITEGWISRGRDTLMEQYIISNLLTRCGQAGAPPVVR